MHRCASIAPSSLRPRRTPCQVGEKCSSPPYVTVFPHHCSEETFPQRGIILVPSIPFSPLRLSIVVPFEECALQGVWNAPPVRVPEQRPVPYFAREYFFAAFEISSTPMPSVLSGPTDRYGGAHKEELCGRGAALRLCPFASFFAVLKRIVFALVTMCMSSGSRSGMSAWNSALFP